MWLSKTVSVVFPAYNEEPNIEAAVADFKSVEFGNGPVFDEILVVNNNSRDRTGELAEKAGARVVDETRQGYGNALQRGLKEATGDIVVLCEPDGTFVARDVLKLLAYADDFEMVCGTRTTRELIYQEANMGFFLRWGNYAVAKMLEVLYGTSSLTDCGCTFRLIRRDAIPRIQPDLFVGRSHFLPNMVIAARKNGVTMIEVPVIYRGRVGESKITGSIKGMFKTGFAMIGVILSMWPGYMRKVRGQA
jgi:glycosyltransferase involved in cell wall biosynthesis